MAITAGNLEQKHIDQIYCDLVPPIFDRPIVIDKSFILPISKDYVRHWGIQEAIRELLQNAIDSESKFTFEIAGNKLIISNDDATLSPSDLILGQSSKHDDDDAIGQFGEGFKLALAVLAREDREIVIYNGDLTWIPIFTYNDDFKGDVLRIDQFCIHS